MRFYDLQITKPGTGQVLKRYSSLVAGPGSANDPGALQIEFDIPISTFAEPAGTGYIALRGIDIKTVAQSSDFNFMNLTLLGGMSKGLPLATLQQPQSGTLVRGQIQQAFGNWVGTDMSLTLLVSSGLALGNAPVNLPLLWRAGTPMKDAIVNSLKIGFPGYTVSCNISPNLVLQNDEVGFYENVTQFAQWARNLSLDIVKTEGYTGVEIVVQQSNFVVFDGTSPVMPKAIAPTDLVGQPSWFAPNSISAALVMRGDLNINDYITFPKVQFTTQASALTQYASKSIFQGVFQIYKIRHTGNSRQPSGTSWTSTIECVQLPGGGSK